MRLDFIICDYCKSHTEPPLSSIEIVFRKPANPAGWDEESEKRIGEICKTYAKTLIEALQKPPEINIHPKPEEVYRTPYMGGIGDH
jgi:hypothetical protein